MEPLLRSTMTALSSSAWRQVGQVCVGAVSSTSLNRCCQATIPSRQLTVDAHDTLPLPLARQPYNLDMGSMTLAQAVQLQMELNEQANNAIQQQPAAVLPQVTSYDNSGMHARNLLGSLQSRIGATSLCNVNINASTQARKHISSNGALFGLRSMQHQTDMRICESDNENKLFSSSQEPYSTSSHSAGLRDWEHAQERLHFTPWSMQAEASHGGRSIYDSARPHDPCAHEDDALGRLTLAQAVQMMVQQKGTTAPTSSSSSSK